MKTKRKTWYLQKKDILYVEENHDGKYGAKGKERLPKRKLTPEDVQRVNAWNKSKRARLRLMEYFSPGDLWVTFTYKPENRPPDMDTAKKQFLKMMDKLRTGKKAGCSSGSGTLSGGRREPGIYIVLSTILEIRQVLLKGLGPMVEYM